MQTLPVRIQVQWLDGSITPHEVTVDNIARTSDLKLALNGAYPISSTHTAPGIGRFRVLAHRA